MSDARRRRVATRWLRQRYLPEDPATVAVASRLLAVRSRGTGLGLAVGAALYVPIAVFAPSGSLALGTVIPLVGTVVMVAVLPAISSAVAVGRAVPGPGPHLAHGTRPRLDDYLLPAQRWWPPATVLLATVVTLAYVAVPPPDPMTGRAEALATWALASLVVAVNELLARWVVRRPRPAGSPIELAVRDEITGDLLGSLFAIAVPGLVVAALGAEYVPVLLTLGFALAVIPALLERDRRRRVRERLWHVPAA